MIRAGEEAPTIEAVFAQVLWWLDVLDATEAMRRKDLFRFVLFLGAALADVSAIAHVEGL